MKKLKNLTKYCDICGGLFGTHYSDIHLAKVLDDMVIARRRDPLNWTMYFNKEILEKEVMKW